MPRRARAPDIHWFCFGRYRLSSQISVSPTFGIWGNMGTEKTRHIDMVKQVATLMKFHKKVRRKCIVMKRSLRDHVHTQDLVSQSTLDTRSSLAAVQTEQRG